MAVKAIFVLTLSVITLYVAVKLNASFKEPDLPTFENTWWGPEVSEINNKIRPFTINVSRDVIDDLNYRLSKTRIVPPLEDAQQQYGMNTNLLNDVIKYWRTEYKWKEREVYLNKYSQFITNIQGLDIHYLHVKPKNVENRKVLPLLILHGWPGSPREFYELIPYLTEINEKNKNFDFIFELIIPSLPGYSFSQGSIKKGFGPSEIGVVMKNLMLRLGFEQFYLQGGDWGANIAADMSALFPNHILGTHSNMCFSSAPKPFFRYLLNSFFPFWFLEKQNRMPPLGKLLNFYLVESGYFHIQATKPDTVGVGLNDSPAGLAAYILEKFSTLTNPDYRNRDDGGLRLKFSYDSLLDNIMLHWINKSMTSAMRLYYEGTNKKEASQGVHRCSVTVPYACAKFPFEVFYMPDNVLRKKFLNLIQTTYIEEGGHFAAMERPDLLAEDVWKAIEKMEQFHSNKKIVT